MYPYWIIRYLPDLPKELPLFGRSDLTDETTLFKWYSLRFWRFILVYRLSD